MRLTVSTEVIEGTVLFTDIVGFTAFTAEEGDERAVDMLSVQDRIVRESLPTDARVVKDLGDGLMLWFPDPGSALVTAASLMKRFADENAGGPFPLWVRMGAHAGRQRRRRDDLVGHDVNVAARIADLAGPREILVSEQTRIAAGGDVQGVVFEEIGPAMVRGVPDAVWLLRVLPA